MAAPSPRIHATDARRPSQAGFALVEVIVTALMVSLIALLLVGVIAAGQTTSNQRHKAEADELAQQDQERLRGMSLEQLGSLLPTSKTVTVDGTNYTVTSQGRFVSSSDNGANGSTSCTASNGTADYVAVRSKVTWSGQLGSQSGTAVPVEEESVVAPPAGGTLLTRVYDQTNTPLLGARVVATPASSGASGTHAATTDSSGCTIFPALDVGDYSVGATKTGYVDKDGNSSPSLTATANTSSTATSTFTIGQAGSITATFKTTISGVTYSNQQAPSITYNNAQMATPGITNPTSNTNTSITTPTNLFPFYGTSYTNNYGVWAGKCTGNKPASTTNIANATVNPGANGATAVTLPPVILKVSYKKSTGTTLVQPDHIVIYNGCNPSFTSFEQWNAPVRGTGSREAPTPPEASAR